MRHGQHIPISRWLRCDGDDGVANACRVRLSQMCVKRRGVVRLYSIEGLEQRIYVGFHIAVIVDTWLTDTSRNHLRSSGDKRIFALPTRASKALWEIGRSICKGSTRQPT